MLGVSGKYMTEQHKALYDGASSMDYSALPGLHVLASGLKSFITEEVAAGIETCRRCCGGHGYSKFSGLPDLGTTYVHMATAEGENTVLTQQTTRYLLKILAGQVRCMCDNLVYIISFALLMLLCAPRPRQRVLLLTSRTSLHS